MRFYTGLNAAALPDYSFRHQSTIWWGMAGLILVEVVVFATLIASFFYLQMQQPVWPPSGTRAPSLWLPTLATLVLIVSALPMYLTDVAIRRGDLSPLKIYPLVSVALALIFLVIKVIEYRDIGFRWDTHIYGSIVWTIIGFHSAHVLALVLKTLVVTVLAWKGFFTTERRVVVTTNGLYWNFVVVIWVPIYLTIYVASTLLAKS